MTYTTDEDGHRWSPDGYPVGAFGLRESTLDLLRILAVMAGLVIVLLALLTAVGHFRSQAIAEREADLREKYGVDIVVPETTKYGPEDPWTIDGVQRECTWGDKDSLTVVCLDSNFTYNEIEKER